VRSRGGDASSRKGAPWKREVLYHLLKRRETGAEPLKEALEKGEGGGPVRLTDYESLRQNRG